MIADDWKDWRLICDNRIHLKDLYHLVSSASSTCDHQKSWSFLFFCCVFESCFVRFRFVLFRWLQMIKKIEDWFAIIFIWNIYIICIIIQKLKFLFFLLYILELFCFVFVEMIVDDWKDWRLICDNQLHLKDLYLFVEMIVDDWRDWRLICDNRLYLKDLYHFFYIYQKVLKGYPVSRVKSSIVFHFWTDSVR